MPQVNEHDAALTEILRQRGMTRAELADRAGMPLADLKKLRRRIGRGFNPRRAFRVERVLECPIWTPAAEFHRRMRIQRFLGMDILTVPVDVLRKQACALGVRRTQGWWGKRRLFAHIEKHLNQIESPSHP